MTTKIVIIGGGMTGLTAAWRLQQGIDKQEADLDYCLLEASDRLGGKIDTARHDGFIIERGPDSYLARKPELTQLATELGLADKLVHNATGKAFIFAGRKLHAIPAGSIMGVPTDQAAFLDSDLFSEAGKTRALQDLTLPKLPDVLTKDQAMGEFFRRRLGDEVVANLIEPLLSGVYGGKMDQMSLLATYPQFAKVEDKYGSLIRGMKEQSLEDANKVPVKAGSQGAFYNFTTGMMTLIEALESHLPAQKIHKNDAVTSCDKLPDGTYQLVTADGKIVKADQVIFALPHQLTAKILAKTGTMTGFEAIPSTSVVTISLAFEAGQVTDTRDGTGFLVSRREPDFSITACTFISKKWAHSTPDGKLVLRAFLGRPGDEDYVNMSDAAITDIAMHDLRKILLISGQPLFTEISRIADGMPHYTVGHLDLLKNTRSKLAAKLPGVQIAGLSYDGIGLPDCARQGKLAAENCFKA